MWCKKYGIFVLLWVISSLAFSQTVAENCNNGIDDDGDGLIDCNDPDCQYAANIEKGCNCDDNIDNDGDGNADELDGKCARFYGLEFIGEDTDCSVTPDVTGTFNMAPPIRSGQNTTDTQSKLAIGDMDGDGIPDVVFVSKWNQTIRVMATTDNQADGSDEGDIKSDYKTPGKNIFPKGKGFDAGWYFELEISIADIDGDGIGEVFGIASNRKNANDEPSNYVLVGFTYAAGSLVPLWDATLIGQDRPGEIAVADFDGDGLVEILIKDQIYAAETGELLADGNLGDWNGEVNSAPVAVDIFPGGNMELVSGNIILNVPNLIRGMTQVLTVAADMNTLGQGQWFPKEIFDANEYGFDNFSSTSVADLSGDGLLDVVLSGAVGSKNGQTAIFFWNVATGVVDYFEADDAGEPTGWKWGTSRPNLGEIDGDGKLEITFIAGNQLFALEEVAGTLVEKWRRTINDSRSGIVATTVYDFDNDGNPEIVYRDSQQLTIVDGETGATVKWATTCQSHTMMEGPIIADVNGDGNTDLCVPCNRSTSFDINDPIQQQALGEMRCFFSEGNTWLPTRKVWNQTGYYVTNIKDDLQVPFPQMGMTTVLGTGNCANGLPGPQKPFNTFLNQIPYLGPNGCPIFPGPDLAFFGDDPDDPNIDKNDPSYLPAVEVIPPICGNLGIIVKFNIINSGSLPISQNVDVSFWEKDPTTDPSAILLHTGVVTVSGLDVGDTIQTAGINFDGPGYEFPLFIVLNDDGSTAPIIDLSVNLNQECFIDNNVFDIIVGPTPFDVTVTSTDNAKCDDTAPDNGQLQATISIGGVPIVDLSNYSFQWYEGTDTSTPIPAPTGTQQILTNVDEGDYGVIVTDTDKGCTSDLVIGSVARQGVDPDITIDVISDQTQCFPANGELKANITGGDAGYTFQWFDDLGNDLGFATSNLPGRTEGNYTVIVSKDGCSEPALGSILGPVEPEATATATGVSSCSDPNSGTVTATALVGGVVAPDQSIYDFEWHYYDNIGSVVGSILPPVNGTGATRTGLSMGWYAVYATNSQTGCTSIIPVAVEVEDDTDFPSVIITEIDPVTSCDPTQPNGVLAADVVDGGGNILDPADYTFVWYVGDNTLPANQHFVTSGTNERIAEEVQGGGIFYTVEVTNLNSCATTNKLIISENINEPVVNLALLSSNTVCDPLLAATGSFTGSTQASVTFEGNTITLPDPNYTFVWYDGATTSDPVIAVGDPTSAVLSELEDGEYTVVVTRNDLFCPSLPVTILIPAEQVPPVLEETIVGATNCLPSGVDNGAATVLVNEAGTLVSAGYSYEWFVGPDTSGAAHLNTSGADDETAVGLAPNGTYTAQVTNIDKGCSNTITLFIPDDSLLPTVTLVGGANSICDPGLTYNGSITAGVNDINNAAGPVITDFTDYTFNWEDNLGNDVLATIAGSSATDNILTNIPGGTYNVTVTNNVLGCTSDVVQIVVPDQQLLPIINIADVASTNCDPALPNGSLTASVDETARPTPVNGYTFEWYAGGTASGAVLSAAALLSNVNGGQDYTVLVRNEDTGCESTQTFSLPDASAKPLVTLTPITNSVCDISYGFTGGITAAIDDTNNGGVQGSPFSDYTFTWEDNLGNDVLVTIAGSSVTENVLSNIPGGIYTVTATNTVLGCTSDPVNVTVPDQQLLPIINIADVASTNCDPALPNGSLTASVDETARPTPVNGYTFEWYAGGTASGAVLSAAALLSNVNGGQDYTVLVRNEDTGCESTQTFSLPDASAKPLVTLTPITNSVCDISYGFTGGITAAIDDTNNGGVQGSPFSDYTFTWEDNLGNDVLVTIAGSSVTENVLSNIPGGIYTVTATNTVLGCTSDPVNVTVPDQQLLPIINIADVASTNCDPALPNGSLTASVDETARPTPVNGYTFEWYAGGTASGAVLSAAALLSNVNGGQDYTVLVRNEDTGCESTQTFSLPDASAKPLLTLAPITNSVCDISYGFTGGITAAIDDTNNGGVQGSPFSDYTFTWEDNLGNDVLVTIAGSSVTENVLSNIPGGIYTVTATNTVLGCTSDPVNVTVPDQQLLPIINIADVASTNCDPALPNGSLTASVDETARPTPVNGYTFEWYAGGTASGAVLSAAALLSNVNGGQDYTVLVRNEDTGCESTQTFSLPDASAKPLLTLAPITNSVCDISYGFTGGITAAVDDTNNGGVQGSPFSDYTFTWEDNLGNDVLVTIAGSSVTENVLSNIPGGIYTVTATNTVLGCTSDPVNVTVPDQQLLPIINIADVASTNCDPALPNGSLTASVDETARPTPVNGYTFEWYAGGTASGAVLSAAALLSNVNGGQDYTVLVRNEDTGCESTQTFSLPDASAKPLLTLTPITNSVCDISYGFSGGITAAVDDTNNGGVQGSPFSDYTFTWEDNLGNDVLVTIAGSSVTENILSNIPGGIYTVTATNTVLGCTSDPVNVTVPDQQLLPIINIADVASTNCDPALPNGSLTASVDETARPSPVNGYTFEWYAGGTASGAVLSAAALLSNVNGGQDYTVLVRNEDTGCESTQTFSLPDASAKPSVVLVATPNSVCGGGTDLFNGTITVGITDDNHPGGPAIDLPSEIADFSIQWLNSGGTDATTLPGVTIHPDGNILEQLPDDTYTITVTNTITGCISISQSIILPKTIVLPSPLITIIQDQTSCDSASPNGSVSADGDGLGTTAGFQFEWFVGNNTSTPFIDGTHGTIGGSEGHILSDLTGGDYSVRVTDLGTGCVNFVSKNLPETIVKPTVDLVLMNPNTVCDDSSPSIDFNGDIEVEINGGTVILPDPNFEITWFDGETTADPVLVTIDGSSLTTGNPTVATLQAGKYTVVVLDKSSTCTSQPLTVEVTDVLQTPTILLTDTDQTSCNPLTLNGTLQMDAAGSPGPYTITLFSGTDLTGPQISSTSSVNTVSQNALASGNYTVQVVDETTGCSAQSSIFIKEIIERPLLSASVTAPITDCTLDGEITPDITNSATIPAPLGYNFDWYEGPNTAGGILTTTTGANGDPSTILSTTNTGVNIYSGFYTVVATDIDANCSTDPFTIFLDRPLPLLTLKYKVNFEPSDCNQNTGIVTGWVDVDGDDDPYDPLEVPDYTKYSFEWYVGNPTDPNVNYFTNPPPVFNPADQLDVDLNDRYNSAPGGAGVKDTDYFDNFSVDNGATLYDVSDGRYTMVVTDLANGCKEFIPIDIRFQDSQVTTLVTVTDVTSCVVDNGTIDVTVTNTNGFSQVDYGIYLYSGNNITGPSIASGKKGGYISDFSTDENRWSTIRGTATGDVDGISGVNDVLEFYANASGGNHRLLKSMFIAGNSYDISFDFFIPATNTNVDGISVRLGSGTVLTNQLGVTGVWTTVTLNNVAVNNPELRIFSMVGASDGFVGANLPTDDVFYIKNFVATDLSPPLFENLAVGVYTINSQQEFGSNCLSTPVTIVIDSAARQPVLSATIVNNDDCNLGNGSISVSAIPGPLDTAPLSGVSYSYSWSSTETINPVEINTPTITLLAPGEYTVQVTDDNSQCVISRTYTVEDQPTLPDIVQITATPNDFCSPNINGTLQIADVDVTSGDVDDYSFTVYMDGSAAGNIMAPQPTTSGGGAITAITFENLASGTYYVVAERITPGPGFGCSSIPTLAESVVDNSSNPFIVFTVQENTSCDLNPDGILTATIDAPTPSAGNYGFEWFIGTGTNPADAFNDPVDGAIASLNNIGSISNVAAGTYTVRVTDPISNCTTTSSFTVVDDLETPEILTHVPNPNALTACDPFNASIEITSVSIGIPSDYDYEWYASLADFNSGTPIPLETTELIANVGTGSYYVVATKKTAAGSGSGCITPVYNVNVQDERVYPAPVLTLTANTACDLNFATGQVNILVDSGTPGSSYDYTWLSGTDPLGGAIAAGDMPDDRAGVIAPSQNDQNWIDLLPGTYVVDIRNNDTGCTVQGTVEILDQPETIDIIGFTPTPLSSCDPLNAAIKVYDNQDIEINGIAQSFADLTLVMTDAGGTPLPNPPIAGTDAGGDFLEYQVLDFGTYFLTVTRLANGNVPGAGCSSPPMRIDLIDTRVYPTVAMSSTSNTACDLSGSTGTIQAVVDQASPGSSYDYTWISGTDPLGGAIAAGDMPDDRAGVIAPSQNDQSWIDLLPGTYVVDIRNNDTGCTVQGTVEILDQPETIDIIGFTPTPLSSCDPLNAAIKVYDNQDIEINGIAQSFADLTLVMTDAGGTPLPNPPIAGTDAGGDFLEYQVLDFGTYFLTVTRLANGNVPGAGCSSPPMRIDLIDTRVYPTVAMSSTSNTACDLSGSTGTIQAVVDQASPGSSYDYTWISGTDPLGGAIAAGDMPDDRAGVIAPSQNDQNWIDLLPGTYVVDIRNNDTGCTVQGTVEILDQPETIDIIGFTPTPLSSCDPLNAAIKVYDNQDIEINGIAQSFADLTLVMTDAGGTPLPNPPIAGTDAGGDFLEYQVLDFGTYFLTVTRLANGNVPGAGCSSPPMRIDLIDTRVYPTVAMSSTSNTACDLSGSTGTIQAVVDQASPGSSYDYTWISGTDPLGGAIAAGDMPDDRAGVIAPSQNDQSWIDLLPGTYVVDIRNNDTGCTVQGTVEILDQPETIDIIGFTPTPLSSCDPLNAAIKIYDNQDIEINGIAQSFADLTLVMTDAGGTPLPNPPIAGTDAGGDFLEYQVLDFGTYFLTVTRLANGNVPGAGCSSPPMRIDLIDTRVYPTVAMSSTSNTACDLSGSTGTIQAVVDQASPGTSYDYIWLSGTDPLGGAIAAGDMPDDRAGVIAPSQNDQSWIDLLPGTYVVDIRNNDTGCTVQGTVEILDQPETIDIIGFTPTPLSSCDPLNAAIKIYDNQDIEINGIAQSFADLTLVMTDAGGTPLPNPPIAGTDAGGDFLEYQVLDFGTYFLTVTRLANGNFPGAGCSSPPMRIDLIDTRVYPTVAMSSTSNTACDLSGSTGTIQAVVDQASPGTSYDYIWLSGTDPLGGAIAAGDMPDDRAGVIAPSQNDQSWIDLLPGTYVVDIRNNDTGCTVQGTVEILDQPQSIDVIQISPINVTACDPNGAIKLYDNQDIVINGIPQSLADLNVVLEDDLGNPVPNPPVNGTDAGGDFLEFQTLDFGTYFLTVTRIANGNFSGAGCSSPPVRVDLSDQRTFPELALTSTSNTACDLTFDGSFTINVADVPGSTGDGATYTYDIVYEDGTVIANNATLNSGINNIFPGVKDGRYSITVTNEITNCQIQGDVSVEYRPQPIEILDVYFEHQLICYADGLIEVRALDPANLADYTFLWYRGSYSPGSELTDGGGNVIITPLLDDNNYASIGADTYFVVAFRAAGSNPGAGCPSPPVRIDLEDLSVDPELAMSFTADSSCEPQFANGVVTAIANETDGSTTDTYQFDWTYNGIALLPGTVTQTDNANQSVLTGAPEGDYVVTVTNLSNTGCFYQQGITVTLVQPNSFPNVVDVDTIDPMDCNPTGRAEVSAISLGNSPPITDPVVLDSDFSYEWYFNDTDPGSQMLDLASNPIITRNLDNILPGKYYVIVQSQLTGCKGIAKEVEILEDDIIVPTIVITQTIPQISCVVPFTAELSAIADGFDDTNPDYSFSWYNSLDATGPIIGSGSTLSALGAGEYSLEVSNSVTGCSASALYIIEDESVDYLPVIITSQNPLQSCVAPDGEAIANFQPIQGYPFTYDYTFDWWLGDNPDFSSAPLIADNPTASNLTDGLYTVRVTDNNSQCTKTAVVEVLDDRRDPQLVITLDNPLINCDPAKPNGQLSVAIDGGQIASLYAIEWYSGTTVSGPVLATTDILIGQSAGSYTASVTNKLTGCNTILSESITDGRVDPPSPDPFVVSHVTHCIVPNGIIDVTVGGATQGYTFSWYDGPTDNDANLSFNQTVFDLEVGVYAVTATDKVTGCVSPPSAVEVLDLTEIPELGFVTGPSFCETPTGFAEVKVVNNVVGQSFDWVNLETGETGSGPGLYDIFAGRYEVTVTSVDGCVNIGEVEIGTEINGYQGVSANGDGENDYFHIDCISNFPDNNVQIYNRVGVLVYEANGYNNFDVIFEGIGRNGLYLMGEDVPDGTYFYIIDKRDGSKQITGYLELIR